MIVIDINFNLALFWLSIQQNIFFPKLYTNIHQNIKKIILWEFLTDELFLFSFDPYFLYVPCVDSKNNQVIAEREISENDPLLLNYGCLSNDLFLLDYGFIVPSNPYDCIELKYDGALLDAASMAAGVSSPNFSSPAPWQKDILAQLNLDGEAPVLKVILFFPFYIHHYYGLG